MLRCDPRLTRLLMLCLRLCRVQLVVVAHTLRLTLFNCPVGRRMHLRTSDSLVEFLVYQHVDKRLAVAPEARREDVL